MKFEDPFVDRVNEYLKARPILNVVWHVFNIWGMITSVWITILMLHGSYTLSDVSISSNCKQVFKTQWEIVTGNYGENHE